MTFSTSNDGIINVRDRTLHLFNDLIITPLISHEDAGNALRLTNQTRIPAYAEAIIAVKLPRYTTYDFKTPAITEIWPGLQQRGIGVAKILVQPKSAHTICRIINTQPNEQILPKGMTVAFLATIDDKDPFNKAALQHQQGRAPSLISAMTEQIHSTVTSSSQISLEETLKAINATGLKLDQAKAKLSSEDFEQLIALLYEYRHLFISDDSQLTRSRLPEASIPLLNEKPVKLKPYVYHRYLTRN